MNSVTGQTGHPAVSVVIPAYNRAHLISRALDSIDQQTVAPADVLVIDDGSVDGTAEIARARGAIVLETGGNIGSGPARNLGVEKATGTWIAFLDSDDAWAPDHLERLLASCEGHVLVCSAGRTDGGSLMGNPTSRPITLDARRVLDSGEIVVTSACMVRRDALVDAGLFRPLRRAQDLDMWIRVLGRGSGVALPNQTVTYFVHGEQASRDTDLMRECFDRIVEHCSSEPWFDEQRDVDRALARIRWDELRATQRETGVPDALTELGWFVRRPHTWRPLVDLLHLRRLRRKGSELVPAAPVEV